MNHCGSTHHKCSFSFAALQQSSTSRTRWPLPSPSPPTSSRQASPGSPRTPPNRGLPPQLRTPPHRFTPPRRRRPVPRAVANRHGGARTARLESLHDVATTLAADHRHLISIQCQRLAAEEECRAALQRHLEAVAYPTFYSRRKLCSQGRTWAQQNVGTVVFKYEQALGVT